jgi:hypothetical protein
MTIGIDAEEWRGLRWYAGMDRKIMEVESWSDKYEKI